MTTKQLNQRQVRWSEFLSQFGFTIVYRPGAKATIPDALSRLPGDKPRDAEDDRLQHRNRILLPHNKIDPIILEELLQEVRQSDCAEIIAALDPVVEQKPLNELLHQAYATSQTAQDILTALRNQTQRRWPKPIRRILRCDKTECKIVDGLMRFRNRIYVPDEPGLRLEITHRTHSSGPAGHPGRIKTLDLLNRTYWWPGMSNFTA